MERLAWFDVRPDTAHWIAWAAVRRIQSQDDRAAQRIAVLPWIIDGINTREAGILDDLSWLILDNPEIAETVMSYQWLGPEGEATVYDRRAVRAIRTATDVEPDLGITLAGYQWVAEGSDRQGTQALEFLAELASPNYRTRTATGIGTIRVPATEADAPLASESDLPRFATIIAGYTWVRNGVTDTEHQTLLAISNVVSKSELPSTGFEEELLSVAWLQDAVDQTEIEALERWSNFIAAAEVTGTAAGRTVWEYDWARDDATFAEISFLRTLTSLVEKAGEPHAEALNVLASYDWIADGITDDDVRSLPEYVPLFQHAEPEDAPALLTILDYEWVANRLTSDFHYDVMQLVQLLGAASEDDTEELLTILDYPWMSDSVSDLDYRALEGFTALLRIPEREDESFRQTILDYSWIQDGLSEDDSSGLRALREVFEHYSPETAEFFTTLTFSEWVMNGLDPGEANLLSVLGRSFDDIVLRSVNLFPQLATYSWLNDGISTTELEWIRQYVRLAQTADPAAQSILAELAAFSWSRNEIDHFDLSTINLLMSQQLLAKPEIANLDALSDGLSEDDIFYLMALADALTRSEHQYRDLLQGYHIAGRTLSMPLAGDIRLTVVRHTRFPDDDPTLDLMEDIALQLEEFMGVPFPLTNALVLIMEASEHAGERPQRGRAYAWPGYIVMVPPRHNRGYHFAVFHEFSHLYWGIPTGAPSWWKEGAAGFLPDIARDALGQEPLEVRYNNLIRDTRTDCRDNGLHNIADLYDQQILFPRGHPNANCIYRLGELFLMEMYLLLGHDATSAAMRQLYVDAHDSGWTEPIHDQRIYDAFAANVPEGMQAEFHDLFDRLHGGANVVYQNERSA